MTHKNTFESTRCCQALDQTLRLHLWSEGRNTKEVHVPEVGQTDECVFAVILLSCGAEDHHGNLPHPTAFMCSQLKLSLSADFGKREHLELSRGGRKVQFKTIYK